jgi:hypothetical protein
MAAKTAPEPGKHEFVTKVLEKNAKANPKIVNAAWKSAGHSGSISGSYVAKIRSDMGLTRPRKKRKFKALATGLRPPFGRPAQSGGIAGRPAGTGSSLLPRPNGSTLPAGPDRLATARPQRTERGQVLVEIESELDRLLFQIMGVGGLPAVENLLRDARRLVILHAR